MMFRRRRASTANLPPANPAAARPEPIHVASGAAEELARVGRSAEVFEFAKQSDDFLFNASNSWILQRSPGYPLEAIEPGGVVLLYDVARLPEGGWGRLPPQGGIAPPLEFHRRQHRLFLRWTDVSAASPAHAPAAAPARPAPAAQVAPAPPAPRQREAAPDRPRLEPVTTALPLAPGSAVAVLSWSAGRTLVACTATVGQSEQVGAVVDLAAAGGFGDDFGRTLFELGTGDSTVTALSADERSTSVVVGGYAAPRGETTHGVVVRLTAEGTLDRDFGDRGVVALDTEHSQVVDVQVLPTGETLVLTRLVTGPDRTGAAVLLLDPAGAPVPGFGRAGGAVAFLPPAGRSLDLSVLVHDPASRRIYTAGSLDEPGSGRRPVVLALDEDGAFLPTFADGGMLTAVFQDLGGVVSGLTLMPDGDSHHLVAVGHAAVGSGGTAAAALSRVDTSGRLQLDFGTNGVCVLGQDGPARFIGATVRPSGGLLAVGVLDNGDEERMIVSELGANGRPLTSSGPTGVGWVGTSVAALSAVAATPTGAIAAVTLSTDHGPLPAVVTIP